MERLRAQGGGALSEEVDDELPEDVGAADELDVELGEDVALDDEDEQS